MSLESIKSSRVLLSPLNWGLGHVSRTVPIIEQLLMQENEVFICCNAEQEEFYRHYFPHLWYIPHEGYPFKFKGKGKWAFDIVKNIIPLNSWLNTEKRQVKEWVEKFQPDLIISDQRYGFISKKVKSVIISHQLNLPLSKWNILPQLWNKKLLRAFDEIWIPDNQNHQFSGKLSMKNIKNECFLGVCSRFSTDLAENDESLISSSEVYRYLGIVSGPFPYNQQFFKVLSQKFAKTGKKTAIIAPKEAIIGKNLKNENVDIFISPCAQKFAELMAQSDEIVSRAGYSTLMDLTVLGKKATLIPTPGQAEQIYLSKLHKDNKLWSFQTEEEFLSD